MFEARLAHGTILKKILEGIKDLLDNAMFLCNEEGMQLQAFDSSKVVLVVLDLNSSGFDIYRCKGTFSMGVNIENMWKFVKGVSDNESITLRVEDDPDILKIIIKDRDQNIVTEDEMYLMNLSFDPLEIAEKEHNCTIRLPSALFLRILRDISQIGDSVVISCTTGEVTFAAKGDIGSRKKTLKNSPIDNKDEAVVIDMQDPCTLTYNCRYLNSFIKATALSPQVQISLSRDLPLAVEYRIAAIGHLRFYLAPNVEDEDN